MLVAVSIPMLDIARSAHKPKFQALMNPANGPSANLVHWYTPPSSGHTCAHHPVTAANGTNRNRIAASQNQTWLPPCLAAMPAHVIPTTSRICIGTRSHRLSSRLSAWPDARPEADSDSAASSSALLFKRWLRRGLGNYASM